MNKKEMKRKNGWTLMELCVAMIALSILVGVSVQSIKVKKVMNAPFAYAGMYNLKQVSASILNKCNAQGGNGIYGCKSHAWRLPYTDDTAMNEINAAIEAYNATHTNKDTKITQETLDEILCMEAANMFTLANNDKIRCKFKKGKGDGTKLPQPGALGLANFQTSNMVAYYFLEMPWLRINRSAASETDYTKTDETYFKPIFIDINGDKDPNRLGEDQFPLRIYIDGIITPGSCALYTDEKVSGETYPVNLYCPSRSVTVNGTTQQVAISDSWLETNYPFSYNLHKSYVPEGATGKDRKSKVVLRNISYQKAACKSGTNIVMPRKGLCKNDDGKNKETQPAENNLKVLKECTSEVNNGFCVTVFTKPSNPGLFRLPIM